jgi:hypothetical protein
MADTQPQPQNLPHEPMPPMALGSQPGQAAPQPEPDLEPVDWTPPDGTVINYDSADEKKKPWPPEDAQAYQGNVKPEAVPRADPPSDQSPAGAESQPQLPPGLDPATYHTRAHVSVAHRSAADKPIELRWPIAPLKPGYQGELVMVTGEDGNVAYITAQQATEQWTERWAKLEAAAVQHPAEVKGVDPNAPQPSYQPQPVGNPPPG